MYRNKIYTVQSSEDFYPKLIFYLFFSSFFCFYSSFCFQSIVYIKMDGICLFHTQRANRFILNINTPTSGLGFKWFFCIILCCFWTLYTKTLCVYMKGRVKCGNIDLLKKYLMKPYNMTSI